MFCLLCAQQVFRFTSKEKPTAIKATLKGKNISATRDFSAIVNSQCRLSYSVHASPCATACIYICVHIKDPVVHARVRWIMENTTIPSMHCWVGIATLSQLTFPGEGNLNFPWEKSHWDNIVVKSIKKSFDVCVCVFCFVWICVRTGFVDFRFFVLFLSCGF